MRTISVAFLLKDNPSNSLESKFICYGQIADSVPYVALFNVAWPKAEARHDRCKALLKLDKHSVSRHTSFQFSIRDVLSRTEPRSARHSRLQWVEPGTHVQKMAERCYCDLDYPLPVLRSVRTDAIRAVAKCRSQVGTDSVTAL